MRLIFLVLLAAFLVLAAPTEKAQAAVTAEIDLSDQVMHVYVNGRKKHS